MRSITVTPEELETCASRMEEDNQSYQNHCSKLFSEVDTLGTVWQGKDNLAFVSQISGFQNDFHQISLLCSEYSDFLRNSAASYRSTSEELADQAMRLERE